MTTPEPQSPSPRPSAPEPKDRVYRSPAGILGGVLLLALVAWLGIDAVVSGEGDTPWKALAVMLLVVPLAAAYTVRPAVFANEERLRVRNPLRVVVLPWDQVASLRSGYSNEVYGQDGTKYQLWAIPVSLRARKKAAQREERRLAGDTRGRGGLGGPTGGARGAGSGALADGPVRAEGDRAMDELRELLEARELRASEQGGAARGEAAQGGAAQGGVTVRWAYEVVAPAVAGAVLLAVLLGVG
ncbi:PH domain-containing protein [Streptomyces sp. JHA26]|uniref:PH domain-containing protein n=1 Tax=Streptomyces sp. JHA26 TaxID=1917143 RepID=UPI00098AE602|nr:PH domain-containing protein [Streptomyces sp. JHA26]